MKKLGLCICYRQNNYGSQLQCLATVAELEKRGVDYEIIRYRKKYTPKTVISLVPRLVNPVFVYERFFLRYPKKIIMKLRPSLGAANAARTAEIARFSKKHFTKLSPVYNGYDELCAQSKKYAAVMVGSDQLWAPSGITSNFYNLLFAENVRKISYAASFGVSRISKRHRKLYRRFLSDIGCLSVREKSAAGLVWQLSGREAEVVADPVLLLTAEEWLEEIPNERRFDEPYVYAYFLGKSPEYRRAVTEFAKKKGLKLVAARHMDSYNKADVDFGDCAPFDVGPEDFVNFIRNAEYVFTDSFHGSVFSMLFEKKFTVFNRYSDKSVSSKNSRIDSFCENYGLSDRRYNGDIFSVENEIDYPSVLARAEEHRKASKAFLDKALYNLDGDVI